MKCPYCNNEMEQGLLQGIIFSAQVCKSCKKIIVDYSDKEIQEG